MIKYENHCCGCAVPGYPCIGNSCPYIDVPVAYCDICDSDIRAKYIIKKEYYCEDCTKEYLKEIFENLSMEEQGEVLSVALRSLEE